MMHRNVMYLAMIAALLQLIACKPDTGGSGSAVSVEGANFVCEPMRKSDGEMAFAVYTQVADNKMKLLDLVRCEIIAEADYSRLNIPADASTAVGGLQGEAAEYLYLQARADTLYYYYAASSARSGSSKPEYIRIAAFYDNQFKLLHPLSPYDVIGWYTCQTPDTAYVLSLQMQSETLVGQVYTRAGQLPAKDVLQQELSGFRMEAMQDPRFFIYALSISGPPFEGRIHWQDGSSTIELSRQGTASVLHFVKSQ